MMRRSGAGRLRIAVDLTPMLPGGLNGGVKPAILEFIRELQRLQEPRFEFYFLTSASTHREIQALAAGCDQLLCLDSETDRGTLSFNFFRKQRINLLYAPFGMIRFPACGVPIVSLVVDLLHRDYPHSIPEEERNWRERYFATLVTCADRFQVISNYTGERLQHHYGIPAEKIFRTYLPIQDRLESAKSLPLNERQFFFYPANFWPHKNHEVLLIGYQIYRYRAGVDSWNLVLTGSDNPRKSSLQQLARVLGIEDFVLFKGHVSERELARLFASASALVFPSLHEGFGIPPIEAMRLGVPILASDAGSIREVVDEAGLLIDPRKPLDLGAAMYQISSSEKLRAELRQRGFERAKSFSLESEVARLAEVFRQLITSAEKQSWAERLRRRIAVLQRDSAIRSRAVVGRAYRFLRERV